jgi:hypothetical protein
VIKDIWEFNAVCEHGREKFNIKGILVYSNRRFLIAGWPIGRDAAVNDNEAKR